MLVVGILVVCASLLSNTYALTACEINLHGVCLHFTGGVLTCPVGSSFAIGFCGFLEGCCYPTYISSLPSGSGIAGTVAPVTSSSHIVPSESSAVSGISSGQCGTPVVTNHRIVGGTLASRGEYPWQVSLRYAGQLRCGGTLIDNQWVLTAAHCFEDTSRLYWTVAVGVQDQSHIYTDQVRNAVVIITHDLYDKVTHHNDIALVKLDKPVDTTSAYVKTACLPNPDEDFANTICTATGWGSTFLGGQTTSYLEKTDLPIITNSLCKYLIGNAVISSNICAGYAGGHGVCKGDSGGPLVCKRNGHWKLVGVTSWGYGCAKEHTPGVYTRVSSFLDWIKLNKALH